MRTLVTTLLIAVEVCLVGCRERNPWVDPVALSKLATSIETLVGSNTQFILYSIDPDLPGDGSDVEVGRKVLGQATITDPVEQNELLHALAESVRKSEGPALCFNPRHALYIEHKGVSIRFLICFECLQMTPIGFNEGKESYLDHEAQSVFDATLKKHRVPTAKS